MTKENITTSNIKNITGKKLADLLCLRKKRNGRYATSWGDKSELGLFLSIKKVIMEEIGNEIKEKK